MKFCTLITQTLKENLLIEERKLMKERFEISAERARLEAIISSEGSTGRISDVIQVYENY